jgi:hypothetical protein
MDLQAWADAKEGRTATVVHERVGYGVSLRSDGQHVYAWDYKKDAASRAALADWHDDARLPKR